MTDQSIEDASREQIRLEAQASGLSFLGVKDGERWQALYDFVAIHDREQAARQSSQSEPVAVFTGKFKGNVNGKQWIECELTGAMPNTGDLLYAAPQQAIPSGWTSVKDGLPPDDGAELWMCLENGVVYDGYYSHDDKTFNGFNLGYDGDSAVLQGVTHWQLLIKPTAPIERDK
jgi:hypothetical protein